ncbi:stearoyl-CoA 9-desaturase [Thermopolyspora flexuosa]|jgi:stearoyl-CoA desaturase (delta-9 desaturase)|uniref:Stearoyl-CoA desaturase (Delta-9 desaturase) n=1 Tax=Thermopolyspora flexuosa TaxID=103836 RepID=A0A543ISN7_9ACTN|nr:acyl-CoA desaturase [Thermopolyspora flexuosa]TQM73590.1 stearoyl-CoA desaturase (delta-9 desaturase) [Thermopolyspora flexuosa]GGM82510.1 stearoyl-CoA 9-desaturase [Thermopolyspora flexuosa]
MTVTVDRVPPPPKPDLEPEPKSNLERVLLVVFVVVPFLALFAAIPMAWGRFIGWTDVIIGAVFYVFAGLGVTVGFHRYFTHGSFKTDSRLLKIVLGVAGSFALEMGVIDWVATHRRHHKYSDREGDPHSPWRFGNDWKALTKGLFYAHVGWLFSRERTNREKYARDLLADRDIKRIHDLFPVLAAASLLLPPLIGGLVTWSVSGALTAFFWGTLVRVALLHHVTWSVNSICHVFGDEDFQVRDKSRNVWWLAIPSFGESWHNLHHADPTCARHGALKGQLDPSARVIRWFEQLGWVHSVKWPDPERLATRLANAEKAARPIKAA